MRRNKLDYGDENSTLVLSGLYTLDLENNSVYEVPMVLAGKIRRTKGQY